MIKTFYISSFSILPQGQAPDVSFVPPLSRRRLSQLQKIYFSLASAVEQSLAASAVFASCDGEDSLTRRLVADFNDDGSVSPHRFSASVYNAAPGLWSVHTKNHSTYTAIAAREDTIEAGLIESLTGAMPSLFVYAEETNGGYGVGVFLSEVKSNTSIVVDVEFNGNMSNAAITFDDFVGFLEGKTNLLEGRFLRMHRPNIER